ncbi:MAG: type IV toxin-antitoxin system AbiEi family antitoxin domain-containing protein [Chitinophagales bacterium]
MTNPQQQIKSLFHANNGYLQTKMVKEKGINKYHLEKMVAEGKVERVKRGLYHLTNYVPDNELMDMNSIVPEGIICLFSAWEHYDLSTFVSSTYHIAVERSYKIVLPFYPPIQLYYWSAKIHQLGIVEYEEDGAKVRLYDIEKSVCDAIKYRRKVGIDTAMGVLKNYLKRPNRNLTKLNEYAAILRVKTILKNYLEALL